MSNYIQGGLQSSTAGPLRLNLGCGTDIRQGMLNVDVVDLPGVDIVHPLGEAPLPFADSSVDEVLALDVLEHVDLIGAMRDIHRVLRPGGRLRASVVHYTSNNLYVDPTHVRAFSVSTPEFFVRGASRRGYYFDFSFESLEEVVLTFQKRRSLPWNKKAERFFNRSRKRQDWYEQTALSRLFPALNVEFTLVR